MALTYLKKINNAAKAECVQHRKIEIIILIMLVAGGVFTLFEYGCLPVWSSTVRAPSMSGIMGIFLLCLSAFFGIFAVHGIFCDLTSKQQADIQMSLPMSAKDRYLSKILALCKLHIFPLIICCLAVMVLCIAKVCLGISLTDDAAKYPFSWDLVLYLGQFMLIVLLIALFTDAVTVFCMTCCGAKAEGIYTSLITMFCVSYAPFIFYMQVIAKFSGVTDLPNEGRLFMCWGLIPVLECLDYNYEMYISEYVIPMLINILISCLVIWASYFIYKKRDARSVGKPMAFSLFFELFMFIGTFTLFTMFFFSSMWSIGVTIALIISLIIRIVVSRAKVSVKSFGVWILKYAACVGLFIGIAAVGYYTGGFGLSSFKPDLSDTCMVDASISYDFWVMDEGSSYVEQNHQILEDKSGDEYDVYADIIEKYRAKAVNRFESFSDCVFEGASVQSLDKGYVDITYDINCVREEDREAYENAIYDDDYAYYENYTITFRLAKQDAADMHDELAEAGGYEYDSYRQ